MPLRVALHDISWSYMYHGIVGHCVELHYIWRWRCVVLHVVSWRWRYIVLHGVAWLCMALHSITWRFAWCCMALRIVAWRNILLFGSREVTAKRVSRTLSACLGRR